jgi:hypothetical protein
MHSVTGCVSVAVKGAKGAVTVDRVIEYCQATPTTCTIWIDVFLTNRSPDVSEILILHRGGFQGTDVTLESWLSASSEAFESGLSRRIRALHRSYLPIEIIDGGIVRLNGADYRVSSADEPRYQLREVIGGDAPVRVPFTLWSLAPTTPGRTLFRIRLTMSSATFDSQIDRADGFTAYGEAILLEKIESDDLPNYAQPDRPEYERQLREFLAVEHVTPEAFEYLLISEEDTELPWQTTPLSSRIQQRSITIPRLQMCTKWFVVDVSNCADWLLSASTSKPYHTFGLRITRSVEEAEDLQQPAAVV